MDHREENNYPKAFIATAIVMSVMIGLCFIFTITLPAKQVEGTGGILVNYGTTDAGMGSDYLSTEEPSMSEKANKTKTDKITTSDASNTNAENSTKVVTQTNEDAPEVADNSKKPTNTVSTDAQKAASKPTINQAALYKGKTNNASGTGDGTTNTPGNQGKTNGSNLSDNYDGTGSGNGGLSMAQRKFINRPSVDNPKRSPGKVVVDIQVDKNGIVISAGAGRGTTVSDDELVQKCVNAVYRCRLNASDLAPDTQTGKVTFVFKVQ